MAAQNDPRTESWDTAADRLEKLIPRESGPVAYPLTLAEVIAHEATHDARGFEHAE